MSKSIEDRLAPLAEKRKGRPILDRLNFVKQLLGRDLGKDKKKDKGKDPSYEDLRKKYLSR